MKEIVLVTGATGRIGSVIIHKLVERGYAVRAFVLPGDPFVERFADIDCEIIFGNLINEEDVKKAVDGCTYVIHMMALMTKPTSMDETTYMEINVKSTWFVTRFSMLAGVKRLVYGSSDAYYPAGTERLSPLFEDAPSSPRIGPNYLYSLTKRLNEEIIWEAYRESGYRFEVTAVRFGTVLHHDEMLSVFRAKGVRNVLAGMAKNPSSNTYRTNVEDPIAKMPVDIPDDMLVIPCDFDGRSWRIHLTHVLDAADGTVLAMESTNASGEVFNILGPSSTVREHAVKYIAEITGAPYRKVQLDTIFEFECSIEKARKLLGYNPKYDTIKLVDEAIKSRNEGYNTIHQLNSADF